MLKTLPAPEMLSTLRSQLGMMTESEIHKNNAVFKYPHYQKKIPQQILLIQMDGPKSTETKMNLKGFRIEYYTV